MAGTAPLCQHSGQANNSELNLIKIGPSSGHLNAWSYWRPAL
jgi:hypothetical protein